MELMQAFPIAIIDEDYEGKSAAGRGMRQLAAAIEKEGYRVVAGVSYEDARRLVNVFNNESCWLISVDGTEATPKQWQVLEEVLAAKRRRNDRLPIFLFGDERTAEMVPSSVLKHANAFMRLFEDSAEFLARAITRAAELYIERLPPPMFKALMDYTLHASYSWHTPGHGGGVAFRKSPVGQLFYEFFGENTLRSDISVSVGSVGSLLDHTGPIAAGERNAARIFGSDETLFVVGGTSTANKIVDLEGGPGTFLPGCRNSISSLSIPSAGFIWKHGEAYKFDGSHEPPFCWVPLQTIDDGGVVHVASVAESDRVGSVESKPGVDGNFELRIVPPAATSAYAVEEKVPLGWAVSNISDDGTFDVTTGIIRWGVFFDATARTLSYTLTPPPGVTAIARLGGRVSFDGAIYEISGCEKTTSTDSTSQPTIGKCESDGSKVHLELSGGAGQVGVLQSSTDLVHWQDVTTLFLPDGTVQFDDSASATIVKYYRLQVR